MAERAVYTILVNSRRIEVGKEIYYAYERFRDKERYQRKQIYQTEMSLERFREEGVSVEYRSRNYHPSAEDEIIRLEERTNLYLALSMLDKQDWLLIEKLFIYEHSEQELANTLGVSQQAVSKRKTKLLERLRKMLE